MRIEIESTGDDLAELTARQARQLTAAIRRAGRDVAEIGSSTILKTTRAKRGSLRFARSRLDVRETVRTGAAGFDVELRGTPAGAWTIVNDGSKPHPIRPRRARALSINGHAYASADHPGTRGTHVWQAAARPLTSAVGDEIENAANEALL